MAQLLSPRRVRLRGIRQPIWPLVDPTHPINHGLLGYWQLDGEGVLVPDYSGFGNNGVATATGLQDSSHHGGNALSFNGTSSVVTIPANAGILGGSARSFVAWINLATTTGIRAIFSYGVGTTANQFVIYNNVNSAGDLYYGGNGNDLRSSSGSLFTLNTWNHIAVVYIGGNLSSSTMLFYLNGAVLGTNLVAGGLTLNTLSSSVNIGSDVTTSGRNYSGAIEGARWYNRALDAVEVQQLFAEPYAGIFDASASIVPGGITIGLPLMGQIWLA
jgi:hypothetical protein